MKKNYTIEVHLDVCYCIEDIEANSDWEAINKAEKIADEHPLDDFSVVEKIDTYICSSKEI